MDYDPRIAAVAATYLDALTVWDKGDEAGSHVAVPQVLARFETTAAQDPAALVLGGLALLDGLLTLAATKFEIDRLELVAQIRTLFESATPDAG